MSDSRIATIRKSVNIDPSQILFPFVFLSEQFGYSQDSILRYIYASPDIHLAPNEFPNEIKEYFWIKEGVPGKEPWFAVGSLNDGKYFLYKAYMNLPTNTFINNGHMDLWVSLRFNDLIQYAIDHVAYSEYIKDTEPI